MSINKKLKKEIIESLKPLNLNKIILFGSYAYGNPDKESDIDLYIVTKDNFIPENFKEAMDIKLKVAKALNNIRKTMDIDLVVHTKFMEKKFLEINSLFAKKIFNEGEIIYEDIN